MLAQARNSLLKEVFGRGRKKEAGPKPSPTSSHAQPNSPKPLKKPSLGARLEYYPAAIEFGTNSIKLLQIAKAKSQGFVIVKNAYLPLDLNPVDISSDIFKDSLKKLIDANRIRGEVISSLPINKVQVLTYVLPDMPAEEVESAVAWKLKQNPPTGVTFENMSFDYVQCLHSKNDLTKEMRILVFAVPKETVMERLELFRELSLELIAIEPKPYAALNALCWLGKIPQEETILVLQLGASQSSITIVHSGQPYLVRPLAASGNTFTEAVANYHQLDWNKAEALKKEEGLRDWRPELKSDQPASESISLLALSSHLENLVVDLEHTFKYFSHQLMKTQIVSFDRVVLCGGSSALYNLAPFLTDRLGGATVEVFNPFSSLNISIRQELTPLVKENSAGFVSVLGLALRNIE